MDEKEKNGITFYIIDASIARDSEILDGLPYILTLMYNQSKKMRYINIE